MTLEHENREKDMEREERKELKARAEEVYSGMEFFRTAIDTLEARRIWAYDRLEEGREAQVLNALELMDKALEACKAAAEGLEEDYDELRSLIDQDKKQIGVRVPIEDYEDLEVLKVMHKLQRDDWSINGIIAEQIHEVIEQNKAEIEAFKERLALCEVIRTPYTAPEC